MSRAESVSTHSQPLASSTWNGVPLIQVNSRIDYNHAEELQAALCRASDTKPLRVLVDLSAADHIDTACLAALIAGLRRLKKQAATLLLIGVNDRIRRLLQLTRLEPAFEYAPSLDAAPGPQRVAEPPETTPSP